jgi:hypothetical protein
MHLRIKNIASPYIIPIYALVLLSSACKVDPSSDSAAWDPSQHEDPYRDVVRVSEAWLQAPAAPISAEEVESFYVDTLGQVPESVTEVQKDWGSASSAKAEVLLSIATQAETWNKWDYAKRGYRGLLALPQQPYPRSELIYRLFLVESELSGDQELIGDTVDKREALHNLIALESLAGSDEWSPHLSYRIALVAYRAGVYQTVVNRLLPVLQDAQGRSDEFLHHTKSFCGTVAYLTLVSMVELGRSAEAQSVLELSRGYDACLTPDFLQALAVRAPALASL